MFSCPLADAELRRVHDREQREAQQEEQSGCCFHRRWLCYGSVALFYEPLFNVLKARIRIYFL